MYGKLPTHYSHQNQLMEENRQNWTHFSIIYFFQTNKTKDAIVLPHSIDIF